MYKVKYANKNEWKERSTDSIFFDKRIGKKVGDYSYVYVDKLSGIERYHVSLYYKTELNRKPDIYEELASSFEEAKAKANSLFLSIRLGTEEDSDGDV